MKNYLKKMFALVTMLFIGMTLFAQSAADTPVVDPAIFDLIYNWVFGYIPAKTLAVIFTVCWILEYVITYVKWTPANSTVAFIWNGLKKIVSFLAKKKTK